jgi:predicted HTH domain antitoxin
METIQLELPAALLRAADLGDGNIAQEAARLLALELFHEDKISQGRAAELCQTPLAAFMNFAARHGVPPLRYGSADPVQEFESIDRLGV